MRVKIRLDTNTSAYDLVGVATRLSDERVILTDGAGMVVSAKSLLGAIYAKFEFTEIWLETEKDRYFEFRNFIIEE